MHQRLTAMKIFDHFQHINLTNDQRNALEKLHAFLESDEHIFILQGYAGSGKTTLLKGVIHYLKEQKKNFDVMAPTGRAAKILREKTGYGQTIHKIIYNFKKLTSIKNSEDENDYSFHYMFPIRENNAVENIIIVDEASMISSKESKHELFNFGTDVLLNDLLTYSKVPHCRNKIIFVGDPAQLPPVGDTDSKALDANFFQQLGLKTQVVSLQQVVRQQDNLILKNAQKIRSLIGWQNKNELVPIYDEQCFIKINGEDIPSKYAGLFPLPEQRQGVIIAFSNEQCLEYNRAVRKKLFPNNATVTSGDILIINNNNYHSYGVELMNGEMAKVMSVSPNVISRKNIPVYEIINGKRVKKHITLDFREISIRIENYPEEISCLIIDTLLNSSNRDLTLAEMKALYIDFVIRFKDKQKKNKERGLPYFEVDSEEFKNELKTDPFFNAVRVKYGYAITCHKAQGGEWHTTFVDYFGRTSLKDEPLRWCYTATTRAIERCYAANAPFVTLFSRLSIAEILPLTNIPDNALALDHVPISPFHSEIQHKAKSLKYWEVVEKLEDSPFQLVLVQSLGPYHERYTIAYEDEQGLFDTHHNKVGIFNLFQAVYPNQFSWQQEVLDLLNRPHTIIYNIDYNPSLPVLEKLYGLMQSACADVDVHITNIVEKVKDYYVIYFLKTDATCSLIQFYFNGIGQLTRALPKSTTCSDDSKLKLLITKINEYVI